MARLSVDFAATPTQWIWIEGDESPRNFWLRARRAFYCTHALRRATLLVTADSRYELFVNGAWLGAGPVRSFPWAYGYDRYDITSWLRTDDENVLAVRIVHWGDHTFQYIRGRGGLLCELTLEGEDGQIERIGSDDSWRVSPDAAFARNAPRISIQLGYEEQYDARRAEQGWTSPGFAVDAWSAAHVIGPIGTPPWSTLEARAIPFLTRDEVTPTAVLAVELARPRPGYRWAFDVREHIGAPRFGLRAEPLGARARAFATEITAPRPCSVTIHGAAGYDSPEIACNGRRITALPSRLELRAGRNLFVIAGTEWPSLLFETEEALTFDIARIIPAADAAWTYLAPLDERDDTVARLLAARGPDEIPPAPRYALSAGASQEDIHLLTSTQRFLLPEGGFCDPAIDNPQPRQRRAGGPVPLVECAADLLHRSSTHALLYPHADGDLHLVVDFGRELVGYLVLELDAPAGAILDANLFEGIDAGGIFWTDRLRNSLRYTCREGYQTFRSHVSRGFRYVSLTVRAMRRPIKLYNLRCLLSTYPVEERGRFACSDALLTRSWEVAAYTVRLCMADTYVDCPAYEQTFWVGDSRNAALVNAVAFGAFALTERCLRLTAQSLSREVDALKPPEARARPHLTSAHVVSGWFTEIPMWTFLWIWTVWEHYLLTGKVDSLTALYPAVRESLTRCLDLLTPRGLLDVPCTWNLVDWAAMDLTADGEVTANNALLVESLRRAALMADALADHELSTGTPTRAAEQTAYRDDVRGYRAAAERVYAALNAHCWSERRGAYVDTLRDDEAYERYAARAGARGDRPEPRAVFLARTRVSEPTNTLILLCRCAPPERARRILPLALQARTDSIAGSDPSHAPGWPADRVVPVGSPWFLFFTLETLLAHDERMAALEIIRTHWGQMLAKGATTFWETFAGSFSGGHWSRSLCHGWSAAPAYILSTEVLGVQSAAPGYARVRVAPHTCALAWASGVVPTPHGDVHVRWERDTDGWDVTVDLPPDVPGELVIAEGIGQPRRRDGEASEIRREQERWRITLPRGGHAHYRIPWTR